MEYVPTTHQFVCVLNKKVEVGRALNALGHMAVGLTPLQKGAKELRFSTYTDKDGDEHPSISDNPFIVLRAKNSNQVRTLRQQLKDKQIPFTDFTDTMTTGTYFEQHERMSNTAEEDLEYFGVCFFAETAKAKELTKKFSLYS